MTSSLHYKDEIIDLLAERANVAQFVSFSPSLEQRYSRVAGLPRNHRFSSIAGAAVALLSRTAEQSVNIRTFDPASPKSREFIYGLKSPPLVEREVRRLAATGLYTIINETIDVGDGGVSGVALGDVMEFAPDDTPRCVEKPGTAAFPRKLGLRCLETVYGFPVQLDFPRTTRVEFSLHPVRRGIRQDHTIIWELEEVGSTEGQADLRWPNRFSELIGDKAFGLLVADLHGLPVPRTTVISRRLAPFSFGRTTGTGEPWIRTSPRVQIPGKFTTKRGWLDPFELLLKEDPDGTQLSSVLAQEGVDATFSGAAIGAVSDSGPEITIEGTAGFGDEFMVGRKDRTVLPEDVISSIQSLYRRAFRKFGYVRFEWVVSNRQSWIVQFHRGASPSSGRTIVRGSPANYIRFDVTRGLEELRSVASKAAAKGDGIILVGNIGITSHFGDILRKAQVPSMLEN
jgi:hypothetical protein